MIPSKNLNKRLNIKTKLFKILPYWLIALVILVSISIFSIKNQNNLTPKVLGESTAEPFSVRGTSSQQISSIQKVSESNTDGVTAEGFLVFDLDSGQELLSKNAEQKFAIASLTKLMTGLIAYQNLNLNSSYTISPEDRIDVQPRLGFVVGDKVKALDIFNAMIVGSSNDAALALSHFVEGETAIEFSNLMNLEAKELGMNNTSFSNPIGFDSENNFSTPEDLKILITKTQSYSVFTDLGRRENYNFTSDLKRNYYAKATNQLLKKNQDVYAIKTGFTNGAGEAMATKFNFSGKQIVVLVLDSVNRESDTLKLKKLVEDNFKVE